MALHLTKTMTETKTTDHSNFSLEAISVWLYYNWCLWWIYLSHYSSCLDQIKKLCIDGDGDGDQIKCFYQVWSEICKAFLFLLMRDLYWLYWWWWQFKSLSCNYLCNVCRLVAGNIVTVTICWSYSNTNYTAALLSQGRQDLATG